MLTPVCFPHKTSCKLKLVSLFHRRPDIKILCFVEGEDHTLLFPEQCIDSAYLPSHESSTLASDSSQITALVQSATATSGTIARVTRVSYQTQAMPIAKPSINLASNADSNPSVY
ncbi:hypothetical protein KP509_18G014000 [Ceratopteris richardii]|uniref:Uncharacterized protein n=1 Tax=Ceratopteris richardii TaxID=49495 RepID=A0A8T2SR03_CERRI|nr:hypothetical protein KP509_18G014000 [Ceratopteris richardii]